jgi:hypothetical protein
MQFDLDTMSFLGRLGMDRARWVEEYCSNCMLRTIFLMVSLGFPLLPWASMNGLLRGIEVVAVSYAS